MIWIAKAGDTVELKCYSLTKTKWYFNYDGNLSYNSALSLDNHLTIANVEISNEGKYDCKGITPYTHQMFFARATLHVPCKISVDDFIYCSPANSAMLLCSFWYPLYMTWFMTSCDGVLFASIVSVLVFCYVNIQSY